MSAAAVPTPDELFPIPKAAICNDSVTGFDLYVRLGDRFVLYKSGAAPFDNERLLHHGIDTLYVSISDRAAFEEYLERHVEAIMEDEGVAPGEKAGILYHMASSALEALFHDPTDPETASRVRGIAAVTVDQIVRNRSVLGNLVRMAARDHHAYTHSVNVCTYATALGARLRIFSEEELRVLGLAAMLHDIGKAKFEPEVLDKEEGLTPVEWALMRRHPEWSAEMLNELAVLPSYGVRAVLEHHESLDGSGYPAGLRDGEISVMGRILRIADVYEALTGPRPYRRSMRPFGALSTMRYRMTSQFDVDLLTEFVLMLGTVDEPDGTVSAGAERGPAAAAGEAARPSP